MYCDKETLERMLGMRSAPHASESLDAAGEPLDEEEREAFKKIERLVKVRDRSIHEVRQRLERDGFSERAAERAIARARSCRYLDDERFADVLVRSRLRADKGLDGIVRELKGHGIDPDALDGFPDEYLADAPSQADAAYALLCRKPPRAKNAQQAAYAKLVRAGYPARIASEVTRKWYASRVNAE